MKRMKLVGGLLLMIAMLMAAPTFAQQHKGKPRPMRPAKPMKVYTHNDYKIISKNMINRNVPILQRAQAALKIGKNYNGDFNKALQHQKVARELYKKGLYEKAAFHARAARGHAISSINANKGVVDKDWNYSKEEDESTKSSPSREELETELPKENPSEAELMNMHLEELGVE